jgi:hypothetical protein
MAKPVKLTASGGKKVDFSAVPLGETGWFDATGSMDIAKRLIFATSANPDLGGNEYPLTGYYCLETATSGMVIGSNLVATGSLDFTDATLIEGTPLDQYIDNSPLPPCKGFTVYNQRLIAWGVRNGLFPTGLDTLQTTPRPSAGTFGVPYSFGSYSGVAAPDGWTTVSAGGVQFMSAGTGHPAGAYWQMAGDSASLTRGKIRTNGDLFYSLTAGREYRIRFSARRLGTLGPGTLDVNVTGASPLISVTTTLLPLTYAKTFDYKLVDAADVLTAGAYLNVGMNNTGLTNDYIEIFDLLIYPSDTPFYGNTPWVSKAGQPEAFSNLTGFLGISDADTSQSVQSCFVLRSGLFMARETSVFGTTDNQQEPSLWPISKASDTFGACGPKAVALIDDAGGTISGAGTAGMAVMVCRNGISLFDGSTATGIYREIEPILATVNWAYGHLVWAVADSVRKKVFIGLPVNGSTTINLGLVVDYWEGWGDPIENPGTGRKWSEWFIGVQGHLGNFGCVDPLDSRIVFCSDQTGTDKNLVKWPSSTPNYFDYSTAGNLNISSKYITAPLPAAASGINNYGGLMLNVGGVGNLVLTAILPNASTIALPQSSTPRVLTAASLHDTYIKTNFTTERASLDIRNGSAVGDYVSMGMITVMLKRSPFMPTRQL